MFSNMLQFASLVTSHPLLSYGYGVMQQVATPVYIFICLRKCESWVHKSLELYVDGMRYLVLVVTVLMIYVCLQDEEGRCFSDSFLELPASVPVDDSDDSKKTARLIDLSFTQN